MTQQKPSAAQAIFCVSGMFGLIFGGLYELKISIDCLLLVCIIWVSCHAYYTDRSMRRLIGTIGSIIRKSSKILMFFVLMGALIAGFIMSGAIPSLIYYGLAFISPQNYLLIGMLLCSAMSMVIGSCWGTIATMGVALMAIANLLQIPTPIAAGMIVSGAYFGDKFSVVSDTTLLTASTTNTSIHRHMKGLVYSLIPAYLLSLVFFWLLSSSESYETGFDAHQMMTLRQHISEHFKVSGITLAPMGVMLGFSFKKIRAQFTMVFSLLVTILIACFIQKFQLMAVLTSLFYGPKLESIGSAVLDGVFRNGGIQNMLWSMTLMMLILILGGLLDSYQIITYFFSRLLPWLSKTFYLVVATVWVAIALNLLLGEAYLSIILSSRIFKETYAKFDWDSSVLSNAIEIGANLSTPLIPWTSSGVFITATLGVAPQVYLPWAVFNWIALGLFLIMAARNFWGIKTFVALTEGPCS